MRSHQCDPSTAAGGCGSASVAVDTGDFYFSSGGKRHRLRGNSDIRWVGDSGENDTLVRRPTKRRFDGDGGRLDGPGATNYLRRRRLDDNGPLGDNVVEHIDGSAAPATTNPRGRQRAMTAWNGGAARLNTLFSAGPSTTACWREPATPPSTATRDDRITRLRATMCSRRRWHTTGFGVTRNDTLSLGDGNDSAFGGLRQRPIQSAVATKQRARRLLATNCQSGGCLSIDTRSATTQTNFLDGNDGQRQVQANRDRLQQVRVFPPGSSEHLSLALSAVAAPMSSPAGVRHDPRSADQRRCRLHDSPAGSPQPSPV